MFAFRQADGPDAEQVKLLGVARRRTYVVTNVRACESLGTFSGAQLATEGLPVQLAQPYSAAVLAVERA